MSSAGSTISNVKGIRPKFLAFTNDNETIEVLKQFLSSHQLDEKLIHPGDIDSAVEFLKTNASPDVLFVDLVSIDSSAASLDALAEVCEPDIKVIVSGKINEYSFYCWLVEVGISNYLLKPFTLSALENAYRKLVETHQVSTAAPVSADHKKDAKIITVIGARGGAGATTVSVNLAWILANQYHQKTALLDFDPQLGTVALALDLEPGKGLRDALEKPDRIDGLFIDRVMVKIDENLSILSTEEAIDEYITPTEAASEALLNQTKLKFSHVIVDLPRQLSAFTRHAIKHADYVICVTEYTIMGLRESLRYLEYCRDILKITPPIFVANRVGLSGKHQMPQAEFEKGLGAKISYNIPFVLNAYAASTAGEVLSEATKNGSASKILQAIAEHFVEGENSKSKPKGFKKIASLFKGAK
jgi:pilus assembly protein CpaE